MALRQHYTPWCIADQLVAMLNGDPRDIDQEELLMFRYWLNAERFDRRGVNRRLHAYVCGDDW